MSYGTPNLLAAEEIRKAVPVAAPLASKLSWYEGAAYFSLALLLDVVVGAPELGRVLVGSLIDPDSYMRLVRLQEMIAHQAPTSVVARDGSGEGTVLHWSHLLDSIILVLAAPLRLVMATPHAVHWAALAVGPLSMGALGLSLAWVLAPVTGREWRWTAPFLACVSPMIVDYGIPGVVHHHVLVAVVVVMTLGCAGRAAFVDRGVAWQMGAWAGAGLWLSPETIPFSLLAYGALGLAWLLHPTRSVHGEALRDGGCSFLVATAAAFAVDPPAAGYGSADLLRISVVYLFLSVALCVIGWSSCQIDRLHLAPLHRGALGAGVAIAVMSLWLAAFPAILKGLNGAMGTADASAYFSAINEMQPITTARDACAYLLDGAVATAVAAIAAARARSFPWAFGAFSGALVLALALRHVRFATYPEIFAASILPVLLTWCSRASERYSERVRAVGRTALLGLFLLAPQADGVFGTPSSANRAQGAASCTLANVGTLLAPYGGRVVLADISITPELLYRTKVLTVGSLYTNVAGFMRSRAAWRSGPSDDVPEAVAATRASLLLFCPKAGRSRLVADLPANTLLDRLNRHDVPGWLVKVGADATSGWVLYRIVPTGGGAR